MGRAYLLVLPLVGCRPGRHDFCSAHGIAQGPGQFIQFLDHLGALLS